MNVFLSNEKDFYNNGLGFLTECLTANVTEELNGTLELNITYPINSKMSEYLVAGNIIKCNTGKNNYQLFRIKSSEKNFNTLNIYALHIYYDLNDNFVEDAYPQNLDCAGIGNWVLSKTDYPTNFKFNSDIVGLKTARYVDKNPVEIIMGDIDNSIINLFGAELERDNFNINLLSRRGNDNHVKLLFGKNITGITISTDITSLCTKIKPVGYDGLELPEKYVISPLMDNYPTPIIKKYEFSDIKYDPEDENAYNDLESAYQALREAANTLFKAGIDKPIINIKVDWLELSKTKEYFDKYSNLETVNLGDTITANILGLSYETRVIKTVYNILTDRIDSFEIGTFKASFQNTLNSLSNSVNEVNSASILAEARDEATRLLTSAMGGYVYKTESELFIMDTDNPNTAQKVWRWNLNGLGYSNTGIGGPYELAITQDGSIVADFITTGKLNTNVIEGYEDLVLKVSNFTDQSETIAKIELDLESIKQSIGSITDVTVSASGTGVLELKDVLASELMYLQIYPTSDDIAYLYFSKNTFFSKDTFFRSRDIVFKSKDNEIKYTLPCNLWYINNEIRDELYLNYDTQQVYVIHKVGLNADGQKYALEEPTTEYFVYKPIDLPAGDYTVSIPGYENNAYVYVRAFASNIYTSQYATKVELNSSITQTVNSLNLSISEKLDGKEFTGANIILQINNDVSSAQISADKVDIKANDVLNLLADNSINLTSKNITIVANNLNIDSNGNLTCNSGTFNNTTINGIIYSNSGNLGGWIINSSGLTNGSVFIRNDGYSTIYTASDLFILRALLQGESWATVSPGTQEFYRYDLNHDGVVNSADLLILRQMLNM